MPFTMDVDGGRAVSTAINRRLGEAPPAELLDPEERMSVDELRALQLQRLRWTLRHAYDNVPHYRSAFEAAGVDPTVACLSGGDDYELMFTVRPRNRAASPCRVTFQRSPSMPVNGRS